MVMIKLPLTIGTVVEFVFLFVDCFV